MAWSILASTPSAQKGETAVTSGLIHMKNNMSIPASIPPARQQMWLPDGPGISI
jgi:hypothetical protein